MVIFASAKGTEALSDPNAPSNYVRNGLIEHGSDACTRHLLQHTAGIVNGVRVSGVNRYTRERGDSEEPGTGCPMRWGRNHFVLSAKHLFENAKPTDVRVFTFANQPVQYKSPATVTMRDIVDGVTLTEGSIIHRCAWEDLAVVTVDPANFPDTEFIEPERYWVDPPPGENVHCCGFPSDHSLMLNRRAVSPKRFEVDLAVWPTIFSGPVQPFPSDEELRFQSDDLDPDKHYLVPYDGADVSKHPRGFSGAAVWWESDEKKIIWRPNFKFAGTVTHSYKDGRIVRVVKASVVRRFLAELFGQPGEV